MSSEDHHWPTYMTPTVPDIFRCVVFAFQLIFLLTTVAEGHCIVCPKEGSFFMEKSRADLFDCDVANDMPKVTRMLVRCTLY